MTLADTIAATLAIPARITRLPDAPRADTDEMARDHHAASDRIDVLAASGAPAASVGAERRKAWKQYGFRTAPVVHARPTTDGRGFTMDAAPDTAPGAPMVDTAFGVVTVPADAHSAAHLSALHETRRMLAALAHSGVPQTFAWTRPDGSRVEWTAELHPAGWTECRRSVTVAKPTLPRARAERLNLKDRADTAHAVLTWHAAGPLAGSPPRARSAVAPWADAGTYTGRAAVLADCRADLAEATLAEHRAAVAVSRLRDARRSVERSHQRAEKIAAESAEERAARQSREAARARKSRARRSALDFTKGIARARRAATR